MVLVIVIYSDTASTINRNFAYWTTQFYAVCTLFITQRLIDQSHFIARRYS